MLEYVKGQGWVEVPDDYVTRSPIFQIDGRNKNYGK